VDIKTIIEEITDKGILNLKIVETKPLSGGTTSQLFLLRDSEDTKFVVKFNEPHVLEAESHFLLFYKNVDMLPKLLYTEPDYRYIVYSFIAGSVDDPRKNKKEMLQTLVQFFINHYKPVLNSASWGWADETADSWQQFFKCRVNESSETLQSYLDKEDYDLVLKLVNSSDRSRLTKPYLLHGDCGVHNFIFKEEKLAGVIDPTPVYGDPLYDLIYAYCSSPCDLTRETIYSAASHLKIGENISEQSLYEQVVIGLYLRLATCVRHHPNDLQEYLAAWNYWKNSLTDHQ
jgi:fructosamine-3-kinase